MLKRQKEVIQYQLDNEGKVIKELERQYRAALNTINEKIKLYQADEMTISRIHHLRYQQQLKKQVEAVLEKLHGSAYETLDDYLNDTYTDGFVGTMYDLAGQGIPIIAPIDRDAAVKAVVIHARLSRDLYTTLEVDLRKLNRAIRQEITRGIASGMTYADMARNIRSASGAPLSRAKVIARTEGHRIQEEAKQDARTAAWIRGADVVKQWDATLDGSTRTTHRALDGQIREVDKPFEYGGKKAMNPGGFGDPAEDVNCRCVALTRARAALDADELATMKERAKFFGLDKTKDFEEFRQKYLEAAKTVEKTGESGIIKLNLTLFGEKDLKNQKTSSIKKAMASFEAQIVVHQKKIADPAKYVPDWDSRDIREREGLLKHWEKEIRNFRQSIDNRMAELKERGEYDE